MAIKINNQDVSVITYTGKDTSNVDVTNADVKLVKVNGNNRWAKPTTIHINQGTGTTIHVYVMTSNEPKMIQNINAHSSTGFEVFDGDTVYYGDGLRITTSLNEGYQNMQYSHSGINPAHQGQFWNLVLENPTLTTSATRITWTLNVVLDTKANILGSSTTTGYLASGSADSVRARIYRSSSQYRDVICYLDRTTTISNLDYAEYVILTYDVATTWYYTGRNSDVSRTFTKSSGQIGYTKAVKNVSMTIAEDLNTFNSFNSCRSLVELTSSGDIINSVGLTGQKYLIKYAEITVGSNVLYAEESDFTGSSIHFIHPYVAYPTGTSCYCTVYMKYKFVFTTW